MNDCKKCRKCRWSKTIYFTYTNGVWTTVARCLLGGYDGSQYEPRKEDEQNG